MTEARNETARRAVKRALISVYDKSGVTELAQALQKAGVEIVSTGSTASRIAEAGVPVTRVEDLTAFPECLEGRVKTLHPRVHAGILADSRKQNHLDQLEQLGVAPFELVVVNLYPFSHTVASGAGVDECIEQIDIGGPSMVRAAAKNHPSVAVVVNPDKYQAVIDAVNEGGFTFSQRRTLALEAFQHTASYDVAVATWLGRIATDDEEPGNLPTWLGTTYQLAHELRYGENPHQKAGLYTDSSGTGIAGAKQLHGKGMSYNNYQDGDAAWRAAWDHEQACVAIIKHANPCGIAVSEISIADAHKKAHACDPMSAYGGVIAANREVTVEMAQTVKGIFTEVIIAPSYAPDALELLKTKKNLRILVAEAPNVHFEAKEITGGVLVQERDLLHAEGDNPGNWTLAAGNPVSDEVLADLVFAWRAIRAVKSNAILLVDDGATVGVGMGQVNRVDSARLAVERANTLSEGGAERARGAVAASDAFFPFADGFEILAAAGVKAVVQPGGSIRDEEVIEAAKKAGVSMYLTGARHFAH